MSSAEDPASKLALRLRGLRENRWPDRPITQAQLAEALSGPGTLSVPSISSWESTTNPKTPPSGRLKAYALFFATERSVEQQPYRLLDPAELSPAERSVRDQLLEELTALRNEAKLAVLRGTAKFGSLANVTAVPDADPGPVHDSMLRFPPSDDIVIVCAPLPSMMREAMPYPDPTDPDYVDLYKYADIDALMELYGRLCALNPDSTVRVVLSDALVPDDYNAHLILLGGVDWNGATRDLFQRVQVPVQQTSRDDLDDVGWFEVAVNGQKHCFEPTLLPAEDGKRQLVEDVAHCYFGPSPYHQGRTIVAFNGMYGRGTYGAVRALTDGGFRDRNEAHIRQRFAGYAEWSLLMRVLIVENSGLTPDWTVPRTLLHEWPAVEIGGRQGARSGTRSDSEQPSRFTS